MRIASLLLVCSAMVGCASSGVVMDPQLSADNQKVISENNEKGLYSDKQVSVAVVPRAYRVGEPLLIGVRIYNNTDQPVEFDPLKDMQISLDNHKLKVWKPEEAVRPRTMKSDKTTGLNAGLMALDIWLSDRLRSPVYLVGVMTGVAANRAADEAFERELLTAGTILPKQSVSGYVLSDSYHDAMVKPIDPNKADDATNRWIDENYAGKYVISLNVGGVGHEFGFNKKKGETN